MGIKQECLNKELGQLNHFEHSNCVLQLRLVVFPLIENSNKAPTSLVSTEFSIL